MSKFELIAFDMDGTLLTSDKHVSPKTLAALKKAAEQGKCIAVSTGRSMAEMEQYFDILKDIRYYICNCGAYVYDMQEKKVIYNKAMSRDQIRAVLKECHSNEVMVHLLAWESVIEKDKNEKMEYYHMGIFRESFAIYGTIVDNIFEYFEESNKTFDKVNLYLSSYEVQEALWKRLEPIELRMSRTERVGIEITSNGVSKGSGLRELCRHIGIDISNTIAVGDSDNDIEIIKAAGLGIAMGNSNDNIISLSGAVVNDCNHDGCAEAIENYLLS